MLPTCAYLLLSFPTYSYHTGRKSMFHTRCTWSAISISFHTVSTVICRGIDPGGVVGLDLLRGRVCFDPTQKCHILSFKTVVG